MLNGAITFQRRKNVVLFVFVLTEKKNKQKYKILFHEHMLESFHFMQALKIAQLEEMVWGRIPQGKEK